MLPHHQRAIAVGAVAAQQGSDPRVRAFGQRIVAEQTPEEQRLAEWVSTLHLSQQPSDAMAADGYIDDAALTRLQTEVGTVFDRDVLLLSARSEPAPPAWPGPSWPPAPIPRRALWRRPSAEHLRARSPSCRTSPRPFPRERSAGQRSAGDGEFLGTIGDGCPYRRGEEHDGHKSDDQYSSGKQQRLPHRGAVAVGEAGCTRSRVHGGR